jgi:hypothetical protein
MVDAEIRGHCDGAVLSRLSCLFLSVPELAGGVELPWVLELAGAVALPVELLVDALEEAPWLAVELGFTLVDCWFALVELFTDWLPLPTLTPGLTLALALRSLLLTFALALMSTFGFTSIDRLEVPLVPALPEAFPDCVEPDWTLLLAPPFRLAEPVPPEVPLALLELPVAPLTEFEPLAAPFTPMLVLFSVVDPP